MSCGRAIVRPSSARVGPGKIVAVVGDGAVGLSGVIAARRLGAEQIIMLGRHPDRITLAREIGATDIVSERGDDAIARVPNLPMASAFNRSSNASVSNNPR